MPLVRVSVDQALLTKLILPFCSQILKSHKQWRSSMRFHGKKSLELAKTMPHIKEIECVFFFHFGFFRLISGFFRLFSGFFAWVFHTKKCPQTPILPEFVKDQALSKSTKLVVHVCITVGFRQDTTPLLCKGQRHFSSFPSWSASEVSHS